MSNSANSEYLPMVGRRCDQPGGQFFLWHNRFSKSRAAICRRDCEFDNPANRTRRARANQRCRRLSLELLLADSKWSAGERCRSHVPTTRRHSDNENFCSGLNCVQGCKMSEWLLSVLSNFSTSNLSIAERCPYQFERHLRQHLYEFFHRRLRRLL